jgi:hypothetical protein
MADQNSASTEENPDRSSEEIQRQIPFDAATNDGWAESATAKESGASEVNPPPTWDELVSHGRASSCGHLLGNFNIFTNTLR